MDNTWKMLFYLFMLESVYFSASADSPNNSSDNSLYILTIIKQNYFWTDIFQTAIINPHHCLQQHHQEEWLTFMLVIAVEDTLNDSEKISAALQYSCRMCTGKTSTNSLCIVTVHKYSFFSLAICIYYV